MNRLKIKKPHNTNNRASPSDSLKKGDKDYL